MVSHVLLFQLLTSASLVHMLVALFYISCFFLQTKQYLISLFHGIVSNLSAVIVIKFLWSSFLCLFIY